jgi:hypothetical protein
MGPTLPVLMKPLLTFITQTLEASRGFIMLDVSPIRADNQIMAKNTQNSNVDMTDVDAIVKRFKAASVKLRRDIRGNPQKARDFLIRAGIAQQSDTHPSGVELVPELRPDKVA